MAATSPVVPFEAHFPGQQRAKVASDGANRIRFLIGEPRNAEDRLVEISPAFRVSAPLIAPASGNGGLAQAVTPVGQVLAADVGRDSAFQRSAAALSTKPPAHEGQTAWVAVNEALYRLSSSWSPASNNGEGAVVSPPRPDVIAAYHRADVASTAAKAHRDGVIAAPFDVIV